MYDEDTEESPSDLNSDGGYLNIAESAKLGWIILLLACTCAFLLGLLIGRLT
jgi:hypothetical protein